MLTRQTIRENRDGRLWAARTGDYHYEADTHLEAWAWLGDTRDRYDRPVSGVWVMEPTVTAGQWIEVRS